MKEQASGLPSLVRHRRANTFRAVARKARAVVGGAAPLGALEHVLIARSRARQPPPIFIVGPPRTGSTLLYQLLAYYYRVGYFTNLSGFFYHAPAAVTILTSKLFRPYDDETLRNEYGLVPGLWAPAEAGAIRTAWFDPPRGPPAEPRRIRRTIAAISECLGGPFVWKNLNNSFHLEALHAACPDALFVRVERNLVFTCQSNLLALGRNAGIGNVYGLRSTDLGPGVDRTRRIVSAVLEIDRRIDEFFLRRAGRIHTISYPALCSGHGRELEALSHAYESTGHTLMQRRPFRELHLSASERISLPPAHWDRLSRLVEAGAASS